MGTRITTRKRGRAGRVYRAKSHAFKSRVSYPTYSKEQKTNKEIGSIVDIIKDPSKTSAMAKIEMYDGRVFFIPAAEGIFVGKKIEIGKKADLVLGNILSLRDINEGMPIFNVELKPGDGGKIIRSSGAYGLVISKDKNYAYVKLPSKRKIALNLDSRATIGVVSSGGRTDKPLLKAGNAFYKKKRKRSLLWPRVRGVAMNVYDHPYGGQEHSPGKSKSVSRHAPPGRKVGDIASKRTGRRKK